jgi:hypothetical protein
MSKADDGRWVRAIVFMLPKRREREAATKFDAAETRLAAKKVLPSVAASS